MVKKRISISIEEDIHNRAVVKLEGHISSICEDAIRRRLETKKSDAAEEDLILKCHDCGLFFDEGFICEDTKHFFCERCHLNCKGFKNDGHTHLKIPGFFDENLEIMKKLKEKVNAKA